MRVAVNCRRQTKAVFARKKHYYSFFRAELSLPTIKRAILYEVFFLFYISMSISISCCVVRSRRRSKHSSFSMTLLLPLRMKMCSMQMALSFWAATQHCGRKCFHENMLTFSDGALFHVDFCVIMNISLFRELGGGRVSELEDARNERRDSVLRE